MFVKAYKQAFDAVYCVVVSTPLGQSQNQNGLATGFRIASGVVATAAHNLHLDKVFSKPLHSSLFGISARALQGGGYLSAGFIPLAALKTVNQQAELIAEDTANDLALLRLTEPTKPTAQPPLVESYVKPGTPCGSISFPFGKVAPTGIEVPLRFQAAFLPAYFKLPEGEVYETDSHMHEGSSGCPLFLESGDIIGLHSHCLVDTPDSPTDTRPVIRLAISRWIPSPVIIAFARKHGVLV